jgi:hypothetical protein
MRRDEASSFLKGDLEELRSIMRIGDLSSGCFLWGLFYSLEEAYRCWEDSPTELARFLEEDYSEVWLC